MRSFQPLAAPRAMRISKSLIDLNPASSPRDKPARESVLSLASAVSLLVP